jgi:hypothetical protein
VDLWNAAVMGVAKRANERNHIEAELTHAGKAQCPSSSGR